MSSGRNKNIIKPLKLSLSLNPNFHKILEDFVSFGLRGNSKTEVASSILREWIRDNATEELENSVKLIKKR